MERMFLVLCLVLLQCSLCTSLLEFHCPSKLAGLNFSVGQFMFVGTQDKLNITGRLVAAKGSTDGCVWSKITNKEDWNNSIVLLDRGSY